MSIIHLAGMLLNCRVNVLDVAFVAFHHSQQDGFVSSGKFPILAEAIRQHDGQYSLIVPVFIDTMRIGRNVQQVRELVSMLKNEVSKSIVHVLALKEGGRCPIDIAAPQESCEDERQKIATKLSHVNPGTSLTMSKSTALNHDKFSARHTKLYASIKENGKFPDNIMQSIQRGHEMAAPDGFW